ncbi:hypothetical protein B0T09DRAFT_238000, partial [Sordaria sp. MPI-SDFR-AT-0083]
MQYTPSCSQRKQGQYLAGHYSSRQPTGTITSTEQVHEILRFLWDCIHPTSATMALSFSPSTDPDSINSRLRRLMSRKRIRSKKQEKGRAVPLDSPAPITPIVALAKRHDPCSFRTRLSDAELGPELGYYAANHLA